MKAVVLERRGALTYTDVAEPEPFGERPVLLRVAAVGVCGSDLLRYGSDLAYHFPLVLGHEFSAIVERAPAGGRFAAGDRVAVYPLLARAGDPWAAIGEHQVSSGYDYFGSRRDGAFAERLWAPEANLVPIPDDVPLTHAAMVEPAAVALHAVRRAPLPAHATALVIGGGSIGALAALWLRILGASRVLVADVDPRKLAQLGELGLETIDAAAGDAAEQARELTGGRGVDVAVEATGLPRCGQQAIEACAPRGQVVLLGDIHGDLVVSERHVKAILRRELTLHGTWNSRIAPAGASEWEMTLAQLRPGGGLDVAPLISHVAELEQAPELFAAMHERRIAFAKVIFAVAEEARAEAAARAAGGRAAAR